MDYIAEKFKRLCLEFPSIILKNYFVTRGKLKICCVCSDYEEHEYIIGCWKWKVEQLQMDVEKKKDHFNSVNFITNSLVL